MGELQITSRLKIHPGKLDKFKAIARQCMDSVREKDTGTLQYDWFWSADSSECVVRETYRDSDALFEHMANLGDTLGALLGVCHFSGEIYGSPSDDLVRALEGMDVQVYSFYQSL